MAMWMIELRGEKFDLEELPKRFSSDRLSVREIGGSYFLVSDQFNALSEENEIYDMAETFIERINGIMKIVMGNYRPASIGAVVQIDKQGKEHRSIRIKPEPIVVRVKTSGKVQIVTPGSQEEHIQNGREIADEQFWAEAADKHNNVEKVLKLFIKELTWDILYKIWEVIEEDRGSDVFNKNWATEARVELFTQTANNYLAIGEDARHAHEKWDPPKNPMEINDARALIKTIAVSWLSEKIR